MHALTESTIQHFHHGLSSCTFKHEFDSEFLLNNSLENLYGYSSEKWLDFFKKRLVACHLSEFDWTRLGSLRTVDWTKEQRHSNYQWYRLANHIAQVSGKNPYAIIFAGSVLAERDFSHLKKPIHCAFLIYSDNFSRVQLINRMLINSRERICEFANYDAEGTEFPVSPFEIYQIQSLLEGNLYFEPKAVSNLNDFRARYLAVWGKKNASSHFDDLIYPLFELVSLYFSELHDVTHAGKMKLLFNSFYSKELIHLPPTIVNHFYGQCIEGTGVEGLYLWDIFFNLIKHENNLDLLLPQMVELAVWISKQNPAMVLHHPEVEERYQQQEIGPYLSCGQLNTDFLQLLQPGKDMVTSEERTVISSISSKLTDHNSEMWPGSTLERELFVDILEFLRLREEYNRTEIFTEVTKTGVLTYTHEYVYYRKGVNGICINIARKLAGAGTLMRFGIEDYFLILMQDLESPTDSVCGEPLSKYPFSNYVRPPKDRSYLINLNNSKDSYHFNSSCFYDVNSKKTGAFSPRLYELIQSFADPKFAIYPRIPKHIQYPLKVSTIIAIIRLVNASLYFEATREGEGYVLREGISKAKLQTRVIEYSVLSNHISYRVRDAWNSEQMYIDFIEFEDGSERRSFINSNAKQKLKYILEVALKRGHARSNIVIEKYYSEYEAYEIFRQFYRNLDARERFCLDNITMCYSGTACLFSEIWLEGFPYCMATASKWFSTIPLMFFPSITYRQEVEYHSEHIDYLKTTRRDSPAAADPLYTEKYIINDSSIPLAELPSFLSGFSKGCKARRMISLWGFGPVSEPGLMPDIIELLSITDTPQPLKSKPISIFNRPETSKWKAQISSQLLVLKEPSTPGYSSDKSSDTSDEVSSADEEMKENGLKRFKVFSNSKTTPPGSYTSSPFSERLDLGEEGVSSSNESRVFIN